MTDATRDEVAYHLKFYSQFTPMGNIDLQLLNSLSPDNKYFDANSLFARHTVPSAPCPSVFKSMHFQSNGMVTACGRDYCDDLVYGSILEQEPEELINNSRIMELRKMHLEKKFLKDHLCSTCYGPDPKVSNLFGLFCEITIKKYSRRWSVGKMQKRFDGLFDILNERIPSEKEFIDMLK